MRSDRKPLQKKRLRPKDKSVNALKTKLKDAKRQNAAAGKNLKRDARKKTEKELRLSALKPRN